MDKEDFYHIEKRIISQREFFEVSEEEMKQIIRYDSLVKSMKKFVDTRKINFYDYGDKKDNNDFSKVDESEARIRVGLTRFLRRVLGDIPSYYKDKYRLPIKYQGHQDELRKEFLEYIKESQ